MIRWPVFTARCFQSKIFEETNDLFHLLASIAVRVSAAEYGRQGSAGSVAHFEEPQIFRFEILLGHRLGQRGHTEIEIERQQFGPFSQALRPFALDGLLP